MVSGLGLGYNSITVTKDEIRITRVRGKGKVETGFLLKACRLLVVDGPDSGKDILLHKPVIKVGTKEGNDLRLADDTVSRHHMEIHHLKDGYLLKDLGSTNGSFMDGVRVKEAYLRPGALIKIGNTSLEFHIKEEKIGLAPSKRTSICGLQGSSIEMRKVFAIIEKIAVTDATVVIEGETGTGKELTASAIHSLSPRSKGPFVVFDCGAVSPTLIESELFGHEKGSFTGAVARRKGAFELAAGGSIFLDEIGELSFELQPKLLRAIEQRAIRRVGGEEEIPVDIRVIAASNRDLNEMVKEGKLREDLFFRISVVKVILPPLRQRLDDIPVLVESFIKKVSKVKGISPEALDILRAYSWPGNVRELRNIVERASALAEGELIRPEDLASLTSARTKTTTGGFSSLVGKSIGEIEKIAIMQTLKAYRGNKVKTAKVLNIAPSTLYEKIKKYSLDKI